MKFELRLTWWHPDILLNCRLGGQIIWLWCWTVNGNVTENSGSVIEREFRQYAAPKSLVRGNSKVFCEIILCHFSFSPHKSAKTPLRNFSPMPAVIPVKIGSLKHVTIWNAMVSSEQLNQLSQDELIVCTFSLSLTMAGVINLYVGTSFSSLS